MWGQFAVAAYACPQMLPTAAMSDVPAADMPPDCAREMESKPSPLCKAHCDESAQSNQVPALDFLPFIAIGLWVTPHFDLSDSIPVAVVPNSAAWLADASPPLRIQFQVFRI